MDKALEEVSRVAIQLPRQQRLALARFLIELEESSAEGGAEAAWEAEITERVRAVDEGRTEGIPYSKLQQEWCALRTVNEPPGSGSLRVRPRKRLLKYPARRSGS